MSNQVFPYESVEPLVSGPPGQGSRSGAPSRVLRTAKEHGLLILLGLLTTSLVLPPVLLTIATSLLTVPIGQGPIEFSGNAWHAFLTSGGSTTSTANTILIAGLTSAFSVPVAGWFAWLEVHARVRIVKKFSGLLLLPLAFSPLLMTVAWLLLASPRSGVVNQVVQSLIGIDEAFNIYSHAGMVLVSCLYYIPIAYLTLRSAFSALDMSLVGAARVSGARPLVVAVRVVMPLMRPAIAGALLLTTTLGIGLFSVAVLIGPTAHVDTLQLDAYYAMIHSPANPQRAATISTLLVLFALAGMAIYSARTRKSHRFVTVTGRTSSLLDYTPGVAARFIGAASFIAYIAAAVLLPYAAIIYGAFSPYLTSSITLNNLTVQNFTAFAEDANMMSGVTNTVVLVFVGVTLTTMFSSLIGYLVKRSPNRLSKFVEILALLPIAIPALTLGLGVLWAILGLPFAREHVYGTLIAIYIGQAAMILPFGVQIVSGATVQIGSDLETAARVFGSGPVAAFRHISLPLLRPAIASAWLLGGLYVAVEAGVTIFLFTGSSVTAAVNVFINAFGGNPTLMYAGSLLLATFGILAIYLGNRLFGSNRYIMARNAR